MSNTPLMSEFPVDKKEVDGPILPAYRIDESDVELVVGNPEPHRRCWARFRRGGCQGGACAERKRSPIRRFIRFLVVSFVLFAIGGAFFKHRIHRHHKLHPIVCEPITDTETTLTLPLHKWAKVLLHPSLSSNDVKITHSDDVEAGHVKIAFTLPDGSEFIDEEDEPKLFACHLVGPHVTGAGIHAKPAGHEGKAHHELKHHGEHKAKHHKGPKAVSTVVTLPAEEAGHARGVDLLKPFRRHHKWGKHGCHKKRVRKAIQKVLKKLRAEKMVKLIEQPEDAE